MLKAEETLQSRDLQKFLEEIAEYTYRIKGFSLTEIGTVEISGVGKNLYLNAWHDELKGSEIVVISAVGIRILSIVTAALNKYLNGKLHL